MHQCCYVDRLGNWGDEQQLILINFMSFLQSESHMLVVKWGWLQALAPWTVGWTHLYRCECQHKMQDVCHWRRNSIPCWYEIAGSHVSVSSTRAAMKMGQASESDVDDSYENPAATCRELMFKACWMETQGSLLTSEERLLQYTHSQWLSKRAFRCRCMIDWMSSIATHCHRCKLVS